MNFFEAFRAALRTLYKKAYPINSGRPSSTIQFIAEIPFSTMKSPTPAIRQYMCCWLRLRNHLSHSAHRMALLYHMLLPIARKKRQIGVVFFKFHLFFLVFN